MDASMSSPTPQSSTESPNALPATTSDNATPAPFQADVDNQTIDGILAHLEGLLKSPEEGDRDGSDAEEVSLADLWAATSNEQYIRQPQVDYYEELLGRLERGEILSHIPAVRSGAQVDELGVPDLGFSLDLDGNEGNAYS